MLMGYNRKEANSIVSQIHLLTPFKGHALQPFVTQRDIDCKQCDSTQMVQKLGYGETMHVLKLLVLFRCFPCIGKNRVTDKHSLCRKLDLWKNDILSLYRMTRSC